MIARHLTVSDLMIGDWVQFPHGIDKIVELPYIAGKGICASFAASATLFPIEIDKLRPIPITPEILAKNGFGYVEHDEIADVRISHYYLGEPHFCKNMDLHIGTDNRGDFWINDDRNTICGLRDVHELQHALKLCEIDKTIEL